MQDGSAVQDGRAVRSCQLLFNLQTLRYSDSGSIQYLVEGSRVPQPRGKDDGPEKGAGKQSRGNQDCRENGNVQAAGREPH